MRRNCSTDRLKPKSYLLIFEVGRDNRAPAFGYGQDAIALRSRIDFRQKSGVPHGIRTRVTAVRGYGGNNDASNSLRSLDLRSGENRSLSVSVRCRPVSPRLMGLSASRDLVSPSGPLLHFLADEVEPLERLLAETTKIGVGGEKPPAVCRSGQRVRAAEA
jgi:hypothetical protein